MTATIFELLALKSINLGTKSDFISQSIIATYIH